MKKRLGGAERIYPMPVPIITAGSVEKPLGMTVAWINAVSGTPPTLAVGIRSSRYTLGAIKASKEFVVNIPSATLVAEVDFFGIKSGRGVDKFAASGLTPVQAAAVSAPAIKECLFHLECRLTQIVKVGDYEVVFAEIVETCAEERILDDDGSVDIELLDPLVYIPSAREYRALGNHIADAYSIGKMIKP